MRKGTAKQTPIIPIRMQTVKSQLRHDMLAARRSLLPDFVAAESERIAAELFNWEGYRRAAVVMFYLAMADEPQTETMILHALDSGKRVCVPLMGKRFGIMDAAEITNFDSLITGRLGLKMPDPTKACRVAPADIDMIIVPGVAFDRRGNRLGMGAGYYDRFLQQTGKSLLVGLAWSFQVVAVVPNEPHDIKMQYILTDKGFFVCDC